MNKENLEIEIIPGGMDWDNDMQCFNDYYDTIYRMKQKLEEKGCIPPFTIISDKGTKYRAGTENNMDFIALDYNIDIEITSMWDITRKEGLINKICLNEREFIISRKWIKEWIIDDFGEWNHRLILTDGKYGIKTGNLTLT